MRKLPRYRKKNKCHFERRVWKYIRTTPEYDALLGIGLVDISEKYWEERERYVPRRTMTNMYFITELEINMNSNICYTVWFNKVLSHDDSIPYLNDYPLARYKNIKEYKDVFFRVTRGITIGLKKLYNIYIDRIESYPDASYELDDLSDITDKQLPLHITRKWQFKYTRKLFLDRLKTGVKATEAEIV